MDIHCGGGSYGSGILNDFPYLQEEKIQLLINQKIFVQSFCGLCEDFFVLIFSVLFLYLLAEELCRRLNKVFLHFGGSCVLIGTGRKECYRTCDIAR